jgi:tRNA modification GTPase
VQACFRAKSGRTLATCPSDRLVFGHFCLSSGEQAGIDSFEEVVLRRRGPEWLEVHCHGGAAVVQTVQASLAQQGCRAVSWQDWIARQSADPIATAAHMALANVRTERTAMILLDQYHGALGQAIESTRRTLTAHDRPLAARQIESLLAHAATGLHLTEPWRVVLAGPPNVGKSSLMNALLGYCRAIVHPTPGTTRDVVRAITAIEGWPVELSDTAGLRSGGEAIEQAGIELARRQLAEADLVLLVSDLTHPWSDSLQALLASQPDALVIHNKADLKGDVASRPAGLATSALSGQGIDTLIRRVAEGLVPSPPRVGDAVPFTLEQVQGLRAALEAVDCDDLGLAEALLGHLGVAVAKKAQNPV